MFFILFLFLNFSKSIDRFNLQAPFELTDVNEIGNWSFVGSTVNRKFSIQLTNGVPNELGGMCYRSPSVYSRYSIIFELSIRNLPGNGFYFFFTNEVCQLKPNNFTGIAYYIDLSQNSESISLARFMY